MRDVMRSLWGLAECAPNADHDICHFAAPVWRKILVPLLFLGGLGTLFGMLTPFMGARSAASVTSLVIAVVLILAAMLLRDGVAIAAALSEERQGIW